MPGIVVVERPGGGKVQEFEGKTTFYVILCGIIAAFGGLMFGFDVGISGGVSAMDDFLKMFFDDVYLKKQTALENNYCKYDDIYLQLFTSSLYLAALVGSFIASKVCSKCGRKPTMQVASCFFVVGVALNAGAMNMTMLIVGRILLGIGIGFANQAVPLFLSEIAHTKIRGSLNILFQLFVTIGILVANLVNYITSNIHPWGWRLSLGLAAVPAVILFLGSLIITETPTSLIEREKYDEGKETLKKIRGTQNVDAEFDQLVYASDMARQVKDPFRKLMKPYSRPPIVIAILMQVFQQFTGINAIMFYAPVLFQTVGFGSDASLISSVVVGLVNVCSTGVSIFVVDRAGRKILLLEACVQMFVTQVVIGGILTKYLAITGSLERVQAIVVVLLVCLFVMGFAWSWGPLAWLIPSETFPIETRSAGFACAVATNMLFTSIIAQAFLSMLCTMRAGIFFFFAGWVAIMGFFVQLFLPETKNIPIDVIVERVWKQHWYWKKFMVKDDSSDKEHDLENVHLDDCKVSQLS